jgi:hypothetical protein
VEGDTGTVGITDHAQEELGDIVYVDLPKVGAVIEQGKSLGIGGIGEGGFRRLLRRSAAKSPKSTACWPIRPRN